MSMEQLVLWITTIRALGFILGVPAIGYLIIKYYNQQVQILKSQVVAVKETQKDKALSQIKVRRGFFEMK